MHVSDVLQSGGPGQFCPRQQVLTYYTTKKRIKGKLTPARLMLFADGNFRGDYVIALFMQNSIYGDYIYAKWSCEMYEPRKPDTWEDHPPAIDIFGNVTGIKCKCGRPIAKHNEIDLVDSVFMLTGHPDMIVRLGDTPETYKFYIYEFKSIDRANIRFDDITIVFADHRLQVSFYYYMMNAAKMRTSKQLRVLYIDRSNSKLWGGQPFRELITLPESRETMKPFTDKLRLTNEGIKTGRLPARICKSPTCERAKACDLAVECFMRRDHYVHTKA